MPLNQLSSMFRAFVVQFRSGTNTDERQFAGRAEHLRSGHATHFESVDELFRFVIERMEADRAELSIGATPQPGDERRGEK